MPAVFVSMNSDLQDELWAVLSERGCEATRLTHEEARRLVLKLASEGRHGLCIVTNEAAERLGHIVSVDAERVASR